VKIADRAHLLDQPGINKMLSVLSLDWDEDTAEDIGQLLLLKGFSKLTEDPFARPEVNGEIRIGQALDSNDWVGLSRRHLNQNLLVVGRSGSGKTNLFYFLAKQFIEKKIPFLAFDFKQDFRHLYHDHRNVIVIRWEDLRFNPLRPPQGVNPNRWLQVFTDCFCHAHALLSGSKNFLLKQLYQLYELYDVFKGGQYFPSLHELHDLLEHAPCPKNSKESWYLETVKNRFAATILTIGGIFDCESGFPLDKFLTKPVVIELDGMAEDMQNFLIEAILSWIYFYRLAQGQRGQLHHAIIFDEARRVFDLNKEKSPAAGIPTIDIICDRTREMGEALIVADQQPSALTDSIKANTFTKIALSLGNGKDIASMSFCMGLTKEQTDYVHRLRIGQGIVKFSGFKPFPVMIPLISMDKSVTDAEITAKLPHLPFTPRTKPERFCEALYTQEKPNQDSDTVISAIAEKLLEDISENPFVPTAERYKALGLSASRGNKAKEHVISKGWAHEVEIDVGQGGRPKIFELTDKGETKLVFRGHMVTK